MLWEQDVGGSNPSTPTKDAPTGRPAGAEPSPARAPGRLEGADGIRGLACLLVLVVHSFAFFFPAFGTYLAGCGKYGVWLFFVLSAFLLTVRFERNGFAPRELVAYGVSRFLRIIPLFAVVVVIYWQLGTTGIYDARSALRTLALQEGPAHLWTIPVEFKFYAVLPPLAALLLFARRHSAKAAVAVTAALIVAHQFVWPYWMTPENSIDTRWYLPTFLLGCLAAVCRKDLRASPGTATAIGVGALLVLVLASSAARHALFGTPADRFLMDKFPYFGILWALFIVVLADGRGAFGAVLRTRAMRLLGAWSYSIYLIHWLFYTRLSELYEGSIGWMVATVFVSIAAGALLSHAIELPMERVRHALEARIRRAGRVAQVS